MDNKTINLIKDMTLYFSKGNAEANKATYGCIKLIISTQKIDLLEKHKLITKLGLLADAMSLSKDEKCIYEKLDDFIDCLVNII